MTITAEIGDTLYYVSTGGVIHHYCPVTVVRLTAKQIIVETPRRNRKVFWRESGREVGRKSSYLGPDKPEDRVGHMRLSAEATPIRPATKRGEVPIPDISHPVRGLPIRRGREIMRLQIERITSIRVQANGQIVLTIDDLPAGVLVWPDLHEALAKEIAG